MAIATALDLKTTFKLDLATEKFYLLDITDYATEGIALDDVVGIFTIIDPTGAKTYENLSFAAPDIDTYVITGVSIGSSTFTIGSDITAKLVVGETFTIFGSTANDGTYTIVSFVESSGDTIITVVETIPDATVDGTISYLLFPIVSIPKDAVDALLLGIYSFKYTIQVTGIVQPGIFVLDKTFDFCYTAATVDINQTISCTESSLTSVDNTDYSQLSTGTIMETVARVHTIIPAAGSGLSNTVGSTVTLVASPISTKTWATTIVTDVLYEYANDFFIDDELSGSEEIVVNCEESLCDAYCCIALLESDYRTALTQNLSTADILYDKLVEISIYMSLFTTALSCGRTADATEFLNRILAIGNCQPGCSCDSPDPILIVAVGGTGTITVVDAGTKISVSSATVGNTTTYTVSIDSATSDKIDLLRNSVVDAGTGISVVASAPAPDGTITYTVSSTVSDTVFPAMTLMLEVTTPNIRGNGTIPIYGAALNNASDVFTVLYHDSTPFTSPPIVEYESPKTGNGSLSFMDITNLNNDDNVRIKIDSFLTTTTTKFTFDASVSVRGLYDSIIASPFQVVEHYQQDNTLIIKLIDTQTGNEIQWYDLIQMLDSTQILVFQINIYVQVSI